MQKFEGITADSRQVKKGYMFVAIKGLHSDGHDYIPQAIQNGATVVVGERDEKLPSGVEYIKVNDSREALGKYASEFYNFPSRKLIIVGVTGTKGKTTTAHLIYHILSSLGKKTGLISSITSPGFHVTSPDVVSLHKLLREMVDTGCKYVVIEVSSHGIDQKRIAGVEFEVGVLTNIAPEHLDYHKTLGEYKRVKMSFINSCKYKVVAPVDTDLDILPGKFNNLNVEAAIKAVEFLGIDRKLAINSLDSFKLPEGRLEEVKNNLGVKIIIDFAHTPDSLEAVLKYLRTITSGKLIAVFGCAGERDPKKRRKMGKISGELADLSVFTAEDPRSENIFDILNEMRKDAKNFVCIPERGEAIVYALKEARKGDTVVVLGKGHEISMAYDGFEYPWSDQNIIRSLISPFKSISAVIMAAGLGTRMNSKIPKVLNELAGRPVITTTIENLRRVGILDVVVVVGFMKELVMKRVVGAVSFAEQENPKGGTADAIRSGLGKINPDSKYVLCLYGDDSAFFRPETTKKVIQQHINTGATVSFVSAEVKNPFGLGRVVRNSDDEVVGIVEERDANTKEKEIKEVNCGHFVFNREWLSRNVSKVKPSPSGELYVNEVVRMAIDQKEKTNVYKLPDSSEWQGINTPEELEEAKRKMEERLKIKNE